MFTDTELTTALRLAFAEATTPLEPPVGLAASVRRAHRTSRRRRMARRIALPAAAAAAVGTWVGIDTGHGTSSPAASRGRTPSGDAPGASQTPVAYRLDLPADLDVPCLPNQGRRMVLANELPPQLVFTDPRQGCIVGLVSFLGGFPPNSDPIERPGLTGMNEMASPGSPWHLIFKPVAADKLTAANPPGSCYELRISAEVSDQVLEDYFLPALDNVAPGR